jgi:alpha-L-rhamnosidase
LVNVPFPARLIDAGLLSPDLKIAELVPPVSEPFTLNLQVSNSTTLTIETLLDPGSTGITIQLDGGVLVWESAGENRPDVYRAAMGISVGPHELVFDKVPSTGFTFGVSTQDITYPNLPFEQGVHAGRRLLLAEPISDPGQVISYTNPSGLTLEPLDLPSYVVLDLGRTVHGRLSAEVTGSAGSIVDIGWDERLATDYDRPLPYPGTLHPEWNQVDSWILDGTTRSISTIDARAGRYILIAAWGDGPVRLDGIQIHEERYPADQLGEFTSSNPLLNQIWQLGVDTAQVNMTDAYADPWRERGQWWGDAYIVDHVNRVAFGETDLLMRGVNSMANALKKDDSPGVAPNNNGLHMLDYTMLWVHSLDEYLLQTDDVEVLNKTYPQLIQFMDHLSSFENPQTSLLDLPDRPWGETAYIDTFGHFSRYGQSTALNAIYYSTLLNASEIALQKGEATDSTAWKNKADLIKDSLNTHLYLPSEHRYITHIFEGEPYAPSAYSQAWPLAYGIVPPGEVDSVVESLLELLSTDPSYPNVNIYGMYWVLEALARTGYIPEALGIIELYYGHLLDNGASTLWEHFNSYLYHNASLSHGWGGAATWFLTTHVLGASSTGPNSWIVKPAFTGVDTASGSLPLNDGILWVDWERKTCSQGTLNISSDTNTSGDVFIPFHDPSLQITLDGQIIWQDNTTSTDFVTSSDSGITISIDGGSHEISILMDC